MIIIKDSKTLGNSIRNLRKKLGLNQSQLALAAGVGLRFIVDLERGKSSVRLEQVLRVINALGGKLILESVDSKKSL